MSDKPFVLSFESPACDLDAHLRNHRVHPTLAEAVRSAFAQIDDGSDYSTVSVTVTEGGSETGVSVEYVDPVLVA